MQTAASYMRWVAFAIFSPTRLLIERSMRKTGRLAARKVIVWNGRWLCAEFSASVCLAVSSLLGARAIAPSLLACLLLTVAFWRVNEIFYAFYDDANARLKRCKPRTALQPAHRIKLAIRSYASLTLDFSVIAFCLPLKYYDSPICNFIDALYFSGVTIATLGYGDIKPMHAISKLFAVYEVFSGILLVVVALAIYMNRLGSKA
jgi:hypothetical protein